MVESCSGGTVSAYKPIGTMNDTHEGLTTDVAHNVLSRFVRLEHCSVFQCGMWHNDEVAHLELRLGLLAVLRVAITFLLSLTVAIDRS